MPADPDISPQLQRCSEHAACRGKWCKTMHVFLQTCTNPTTANLLTSMPASLQISWPF